MKYIAILALILVTLTSVGQKLPKSCYGSYAGEMEAYKVVKNDMEIEIEKHDVKLSIFENEVVYNSGSITVKGSYEFVKQSSEEYLIKATFSNGKTLSYQMEFLWNKRDMSIVITGKNGEPNCNLEKLEE